MSSPYVYSFRELIVYQKARSLAAAVFTASKAFPRDEMYSLTDQIRRSSRSIGANIAEAWAKRAYEKHFISKLTDADGEQLETQHWLEIGRDCGYLSAQQAAELMGRCEEVGRLLGKMISQADSFCRSTTLRESSPEYFVTPDDTQLLD
ncbi:MAG TPA: four helix bundle protein [Promineifilum sp.]|nr:four helix bundle protein [Promineifilum sp.]HRO92046.1 four helix bundle protein [Promineifilum sp.]HRQ14167.1 four helix bundle protein [Promineifilum sp.]